MRVLIINILFSSVGFSQTISYNPGMTVESTVEYNYYNTEYIFLSVIGSGSASPGFELVQEDLPEEWSASGCTNIICSTGIPEDGTLGDLVEGQEAYISINLSVNNTAGDGIIRYHIFDYQNHDVNDTIAFIYHVESDTVNTSIPPWATINFAQNVLTIFLQNQSLFAFVSVYDMSGNLIFKEDLEEITSISLASLSRGVYIAVVEDASGHRLVQKVANLN